MPYFLDANNLIGRVRGAAQPSQEDRDALVKEVAERLRRTRAKATLFFDGPAGRATSLGNLSLRACGGSADEAIVSEVERSTRPREIVVVTADRGLARRVRDAGAKVLLPDAFFRSFGAATPAERKPEAAIDVEDWMDYFADDGNRD
jgi:hypothetical protein